jgi:hypothetical protein
VAVGGRGCRRNTAADVNCAGKPAPGRVRVRGPRPADGVGDPRTNRLSSRHPPPKRCYGRGGGGTHVRARCSHRRPAGYGRIPRGHGHTASGSQDGARRRDHRSRRRNRCRRRRRRRRRSGGRRGVADRIGNRGGLRHGLRPGRGRGRWAVWGQERERVEVALRIVSAPHPEVDVGLCQLRLAARADRSNDFALRHRVATPHRVRPEVYERDRVAVRRRDRQRLATDGHGPREGDRAGDRCPHPGTGWRANVDSAVLPGGVRVLTVEREECEHRAVHGPAPAQGGRGDDQHHDGSNRR